MKDRHYTYGVKPLQTWLSLSDAKLHARISTTSEDTMIAARLQSASDHIEHLSGRHLVPVQVTIGYPHFPHPPHDINGERRLHFGISPVQSIVSVTYQQLQSDNTLLPVSLNQNVDYYASLTGLDPYIVDIPLNNARWPCDIVRRMPDALQVVVQAGYATQAAIPTSLILPAYMLFSLWYNNREGSNPNIEYKDIPGYANVCGLIGDHLRMAF